MRSREHIHAHVVYTAVACAVRTNMLYLYIQPKPPTYVKGQIGVYRKQENHAKVSACGLPSVKDLRQAVVCEGMHYDLQFTSVPAFGCQENRASRPPVVGHGLTFEYDCSN